MTGGFFPLLMPLTGLVQVGAGVLQGAADFHFQVSQHPPTAAMWRLRGAVDLLLTAVLIAMVSICVLLLLRRQAKLMALCVLATCAPLALLGSGRVSWGLAGVWGSLLLFQALRALGLCWRFWADPSFPLSTIRQLPPPTTTSSTGGSAAGPAGSKGGSSAAGKRRRRRPWWRRQPAVALVLRVLTGKADKQAAGSDDEDEELQLQEEQRRRQQIKKTVEEMWFF